MTTKEDVITYILSQQIIEKLASRFSSQLGTNKQDYIQEMYLTILEIPDKKLVRLFEKGDLIYYIISICRNQAIYKKSKFNQTFNSPIQQIELTDNEGQEDPY